MSSLRCNDADDCLEIYLTSTNVNEINERHRSSHKYATSFTRKLSNLYDVLHTNRKINSSKLGTRSTCNKNAFTSNSEIRNYLVLTFVKVVVTITNVLVKI